MIKRQLIKSCCGSKAYLFMTETAVNKSMVARFKKEGYVSPPHFEKSGIFYVEYKGLTATASYGSTKVNVRCSSANCTHMLNAFANILDELTIKKTPPKGQRPLRKK